MASCTSFILTLDADLYEFPAATNTTLNHLNTDLEPQKPFHASVGLAS